MNVVICQYTTRIVYIFFGMAIHHTQVNLWELTWKKEGAYTDSEELNVSVSVYVTGKMSWGHITPVRKVGRLD